MSSNQGWPKDTSPNVIARSKQVSQMTQTEAVEDLRSAQLELNERLWRHRFASLGSQIAADPVATEMQTLGGPLQKPDIQLILELFVYLNNEAADMERLLNSAPLDRRSFLLQQFEVVVKSLFKGRQIIDEGLFLYFTKNPDELRNYLVLGFTSSRTKWAGLQSAAEKTKFLKDILDSPKGYPKTARSVDDWSPPRAVNLTSALNHWLEGYNNTSVFSGMSATVTETNRQQIQGHYGGATAKEKDYLWFLIFFQVATALDLTDGDDLGPALVTRIQELSAALQGTPAAADVNTQVGRFKAIWKLYMG